MYLKFFGLTEQPFQLTPDSQFLYLSGSHMRAKAYMDYTVWKRDGFVVITGEIGAGKTTLIHKLLSEVEGDVKLVRIFQTQLNEIEFLQAMLVELGFESSNLKDHGKVELLSLLNDYLLQSYSEGKHVVLIVDEAQNLSPKVLEEIRMLSGLEPDKEKILNVILVGQPELNDTLSRPDMEQLVQRIRLRFHVGALTREETWEYVVHRLKVAGSVEGDLFDHDVLQSIYEYTGGIPRKINILCDTALICAFADSAPRVNQTVMHEAIAELQWNPVVDRKKTGPHNKLEESLAQEDLYTSQSARYNMESAPHFTGGDDQWAKLFSLVLRMMSDMSYRMKRVDERLERLESALNTESDENGVALTAEPRDRNGGMDHHESSPEQHINNLHLAAKK